MTGVGDTSRQSAALLFAPLFVKEQVIGVISAQSYTPNAYTEEHLQLLATIAHQAAIALDNAHLVDALRQSEGKYRNIFENAVVGIYQTSLEGKWVTANSSLARMLGYDSPIDLMDRMSDLNCQFYVSPNRRAEFVRQMQESNVIWGFESEV